MKRATEYVKSLLPSAVREPLWRARAFPRRQLFRMLWTVSPCDYQSVLFLRFPRDTRSAEPEACIRLLRQRAPIILRPRTSDFDVFAQVFLQRQYADLPVRHVRTIVDAGANVGLSARFFLQQYPHARVIAIEPDVRNLQAARRNLQGFGDRCTLVHGAVWGRAEEVAVARGRFRDGREWATQVIRGEGNSEERIAGFSMRDIMDEYGLESIDLLKMDIEGSELEVFSSEDTEFLSRTRCCAIELHGARCTEVFHERIREFGFTCHTRGEVTVACRAV